METTDVVLRGKLLHYDIAQRSIPQFVAGHYADAALDAFKVVEERLRAATGKNAPGVSLVNIAFNTQRTDC